MPTGERARRPATCRARRRPGPLQAGRGFTYVLLLFSVALMGAALATLGPQWQVAAQREREAELVFRGQQIRDALQRFNAATPAGTRPLPQALDELLVDSRGLEPRFHLRRLYVDPFTGLADWVLMRDATGGIVGLHSRSQRPALRRHGLPVASRAIVEAAPGAPTSGPALPGNPSPAAADRSTTADLATAPPRVADWQFSIQPQMTVTRKRP